MTSKPHRHRPLEFAALDDSDRPECPVCREYNNEDYWNLIEQLEALRAAAETVNEELATWEPTERSRAILNNVLLDISGAAVGSGGGAGPGLPGTRHQPPVSSPAKRPPVLDITESS